MIEIQGIAAYLDFMLVALSEQPVVLSFFDRSQQVVRSIGAGLNYGKHVTVRKTSYPKNNFYMRDCSGYDVYVAPVIYGKERYYHGLAISKDLNDRYLISTDDKIEEHFFDFLMKNYELPLLKEWSEPIRKYCISEKHVEQHLRPVVLGKHSVSYDFPLGKSRFMLKDLRLLSCDMSEKNLEQIVSELLRNKRICISKNTQIPLEFTNMDSYFVKYGHTIVENLDRQLVPLTELNGNIDSMCLKNMRLFPQQAAQVNAVTARLNKAPYCILNHGMGSGKTIEAASIVENYYVSKWLRQHPKLSLRDAYLDAGNINYRVIVMGPGHLVSKWASQIRDEIPYAKVTILDDISQLVEVKKNGIRRNGKEFYITSKDFAKLSYQQKPLPRTRSKGWLMMKYCKDCNNPVRGIENVCSCGGTDIRLVRSDIRAHAMLCPFCKNLLIPYKTNFFNEEQSSLDFDSFTNNTTSNNRCYYCGESLWAPHVPNIGENKKNIWYRATHYSNKAHKGTKTVWVHKKYDKMYFDLIQEQPLRFIDTDTNQGIRKLSPAYYIKRQLKNFFDFSIFDEAHLYKSAGTAQGNAMHAFIKSSKKQLALTGTIAGGYASHLFHLLFRFDPARMKRMGYDWNGVMQFIDKYGNKETTFECTDGESTYNTSSRGRQIGSPKERPGISPLIFTDFLLDSTTFLDISDMSKYLPPLKEYVELVDIPPSIEDSNGNMIENPEFEVFQHYEGVIDTLKRATKEKGGRAVLSSLLQFSLSYIDHPYGTEPIRHSIGGHNIAVPQSFDMFQNEDVLLAKERRLIELINKEQAEGRNCFVFAEYTGSPSTCVSYRLKAIIEKHCNLHGQVAVLESASPCAAKREAWMHKKAADGIKVFITNPRCVETGLDFCFKEDGVLYNYPTLIFYQLGYSLFTIWQASRRHYRLNQKEECRTYYMAVSGTVQQTVIELIAQKMAATSAIQGKFSVEGLTAMAQGVDVKMKLAQSLSNMDSKSGANLQEMFDVLQNDDGGDDMYGKYRMMLTFSELVGDGCDQPVIEEDFMYFDIFDMFGDSSNENVSSVLPSSNIDTTSAVISITTNDIQLGFSDLSGASKRMSKKVISGQMNIFGF